jgi:hypothetical protein
MSTIDRASSVQTRVLVASLGGRLLLSYLSFWLTFFVRPFDGAIAFRTDSGSSTEPCGARSHH